MDDGAFRTDFDQLCQGLGYHLGTVVEPVVLGHRSRIVEALAQARLDVAWVTPALALEAYVQRLASAQWSMVRSGEVVYHSVLFSRGDGSVKSLADLVDVRAAWVAPDSASGYLVPLVSMRARGVSLSKAFREQVFLDTHEAVVRAVADNQADVGAGFAHFSSGSLRVPVSSSWSEAGVDQAFHVLAMAGPIPTDVIVAHRSLKAPYLDALTRAWEWLFESDAVDCAKRIFRSERIVATGASHLDGLRKLLGLLDDKARRPS